MYTTRFIYWEFIYIPQDCILRVPVVHPHLSIPRLHHHRLLLLISPLQHLLQIHPPMTWSVSNLFLHQVLPPLQKMKTPSVCKSWILRMMLRLQATSCGRIMGTKRWKKHQTPRASTTNASNHTVKPNIEWPLHLVVKRLSFTWIPTTTNPQTTLLFANKWKRTWLNTSNSAWARLCSTNT